MIPRSRGGTRTVPLCGPCHGRVHGIRRTDDHARLVREGHARRRAEGKHNGPVPFGYCADAEGVLSVDPHAAAEIARIFAMLATRAASEIVTELGPPWTTDRLYNLARRDYVTDGIVSEEMASRVRATLKARNRGRPPFGLQYVGADLARDPETWPTAERIFRERAAGRTYREIASGLNADGLPTGREGGQWFESTVRASDVNDHTRAEYGLQPWRPRAPHGLRYGPTGALERDPATSDALERIFRHRSEGLQPYAIAARLSAAGVPAVTGGSSWNGRTVERLLSIAEIQAEYGETPSPLAVNP